MYSSSNHKKNTERKDEKIATISKIEDGKDMVNVDLDKNGYDPKDNCATADDPDHAHIYRNRFLSVLLYFFSVLLIIGLAFIFFNYLMEAQNIFSESPPNPTSKFRNKFLDKYTIDTCDKDKYCCRLLMNGGLVKIFKQCTLENVLNEILKTESKNKHRSRRQVEEFSDIEENPTLVSDVAQMIGQPLENMVDDTVAFLDAVGNDYEQPHFDYESYHEHFPEPIQHRYPQHFYPDQEDVNENHYPNQENDYNQKFYQDNFNQQGPSHINYALDNKNHPSQSSYNSPKEYLKTDMIEIDRNSENRAESVIKNPDIQQLFYTAPGQMFTTVISSPILKIVTKKSELPTIRPSLHPGYIQSGIIKPSGELHRDVESGFPAVLKSNDQLASTKDAQMRDSSDTIESVTPFFTVKSTAVENQNNLVSKSGLDQHYNLPNPKDVQTSEVSEKPGMVFATLRFRPSGSTTTPDSSQPMIPRHGSKQEDIPSSTMTSEVPEMRNPGTTTIPHTDLPLIPRFSSEQSTKLPNRENAPTSTVGSEVTENQSELSKNLEFMPSQSTTTARSDSPMTAGLVAEQPSEIPDQGEEPASTVNSEVFQNQRLELKPSENTTTPHPGPPFVPRLGSKQISELPDQGEEPASAVNSEVQENQSEFSDTLELEPSENTTTPHPGPPFVPRLGSKPLSELPNQEDEPESGVNSEVFENQSEFSERLELEPSENTTTPHSGPPFVPRLGSKQPSELPDQGEEPVSAVNSEVHVNESEFSERLELKPSENTTTPHPGPPFVPRLGSKQPSELPDQGEEPASGVNSEVFENQSKSSERLELKPSENTTTPHPGPPFVPRLGSEQPSELPNQEDESETAVNSEVLENQSEFSERLELKPSENTTTPHPGPPFVPRLGSKQHSELPDQGEEPASGVNSEVFENQSEFSERLELKPIENTTTPHPGPPFVPRLGSKQPSELPDQGEEPASGVNSEVFENQSEFSERLELKPSENTTTPHPGPPFVPRLGSEQPSELPNQEDKPESAVNSEVLENQSQFSERLELKPSENTTTPHPGPPFVPRLGSKQPSELPDQGEEPVSAVNSEVHENESEFSERLELKPSENTTTPDPSPPFVPRLGWKQPSELPNQEDEPESAVNSGVHENESEFSERLELKPSENTTTPHPGPPFVPRLGSKQPSELPDQREEQASDVNSEVFENQSEFSERLELKRSENTTTPHPGPPFVPRLGSEQPSELPNQEDKPESAVNSEVLENQSELSEKLELKPSENTTTPHPGPPFVPRLGSKQPSELPDQGEEPVSAVNSEVLENQSEFSERLELKPTENTTTPHPGPPFVPRLGSKQLSELPDQGEEPASGVNSEVFENQSEFSERLELKPSENTTTPHPGPPFVPRLGSEQPSELPNQEDEPESAVNSEVLENQSEFSERLELKPSENTTTPHPGPPFVPRLGSEQPSELPNQEDEPESAVNSEVLENQSEFSERLELKSSENTTTPHPGPPFVPRLGSEQPSELPNQEDKPESAVNSEVLENQSEFSERLELKPSENATTPHPSPPFVPRLGSKQPSELPNQEDEPESAVNSEVLENQSEFSERLELKPSENTTTPHPGPPFVPRLGSKQPSELPDQGEEPVSAVNSEDHENESEFSERLELKPSENTTTPHPGPPFVPRLGSKQPSELPDQGEEPASVVNSEVFENQSESSERLELKPSENTTTPHPGPPFVPRLGSEQPSELPNQEDEPESAVNSEVLENQSEFSERLELKPSENTTTPHPGPPFVPRLGSKQPSELPDQGEEPASAVNSEVHESESEFSQRLELRLSENTTAPHPSPPFVPRLGSKQHSELPNQEDEPDSAVNSEILGNQSEFSERLELKPSENATTLLPGPPFVPRLGSNQPSELQHQEDVPAALWPEVFGNQNHAAQKFVINTIVHSTDTAPVKSYTTTSPLLIEDQYSYVPKSNKDLPSRLSEQQNLQPSTVRTKILDELNSDDSAGNAQPIPTVATDRKKIETEPNALDQLESSAVANTVDTTQANQESERQSDFPLRLELDPLASMTTTRPTDVYSQSSDMVELGQSESTTIDIKNDVMITLKESEPEMSPISTVLPLVPEEQNNSPSSYQANQISDQDQKNLRISENVSRAPLISKTCSSNCEVKGVKSHISRAGNCTHSDCPNHTDSPLRPRPPIIHQNCSADNCEIKTQLREGDYSTEDSLSIKEESRMSQIEGESFNINSESAPLRSVSDAFVSASGDLSQSNRNTAMIQSLPQTLDDDRPRSETGKNENDDIPLRTLLDAYASASDALKQSSQNTSVDQQSPEIPDQNKPDQRTSENVPRAPLISKTCTTNCEVKGTKFHTSRAENCTHSDCPNHRNSPSRPRPPVVHRNCSGDNCEVKTQIRVGDLIPESFSQSGDFGDSQSEGGGLDRPNQDNSSRTISDTFETSTVDLGQLSPSISIGESSVRIFGEHQSTTKAVADGYEDIPLRNLLDAFASASTDTNRPNPSTSSDQPTTYVLDEDQPNLRTPENVSKSPLASKICTTNCEVIGKKSHISRAENCTHSDCPDHTNSPHRPRPPVVHRNCSTDNCEIKTQLRAEEDLIQDSLPQTDDSRVSQSAASDFDLKHKAESITVDLQSSQNRLMNSNNPCVLVSPYAGYPGSAFRASVDSGRMLPFWPPTSFAAPQHPQVYAMNPPMYPYFPQQFHNFQSPPPQMFGPYFQQFPQMPQPVVAPKNPIQAFGPAGDFYVCNPVPPPINGFNNMPGVEVRQTTTTVNGSNLQEMLEDATLTMRSGDNRTREAINCPSGEQSCRDGSKCIALRHVCDNEANCLDGSDEMFCTCKDRIEKVRLCDGYFDCPNGEDEQGCFGCKEFEFSCDNWSKFHPGTCISMEHRCDGVQQCEVTGKDELDCTILTDHVGRHSFNKISNAVGFLHRNYKGVWYPTCSNTDLWALEVCTVESGPHEVSPKSHLVASTDSYQGPFLSMMPTNVVKFSDTCYQNTATFVQCPPLYCGLRITQKNPYRTNEVDTSMEDILTNLARSSESTSDDPITGITRVVGGRACQPAAWPWLVSIYRNGIFHCGGVLINDEWVLTAAHCVDKYWFFYYEVQAGMLRRFSYSPMEQTRWASVAIPHAGYNKRTLRDDIALMKLSSPVRFNRYVRPICLPSEANGGRDFLMGPAPGTVCTAVGWGATIEHGTDPDHMREVEIPILPNCKHLEDQRGDEICAGLLEGGRDACQGDSGGPLMCRNVNNPNQWYLAGIVSHGEGCARPNEPGVYTKVARYLGWVAENMRDSKFIERRPVQRCPGYSCKGTLKCLPKKRRCDKIVDCLLGDDEFDCWSSSRPSIFSRTGPMLQQKSPISELLDNVFNVSNDESLEISTDITTTTTQESPVESQQSTTEKSESRNPADRNHMTSGTQAWSSTTEGMQSTTEKTESPDSTERINMTSDTRAWSSTTERMQLMTSDFFKCKTLLQLIPKVRQCDRVLDCEDGTDESSCTCADYLKRNNSEVICDGVTDCKDMSDELGCDKCTPDQYFCRLSQQCVPKESRCDGKTQCLYNEDEWDCVALTDGQTLTLDSDLRPSQRTKGVITINRSGVWRPLCNNYTITSAGGGGSADGPSRRAASIAANVCNLLGFEEYTAFHKLTVSDGPIRAVTVQGAQKISGEVSSDPRNDSLTKQEATCSGLLIGCSNGSLMEPAHMREFHQNMINEDAKLYTAPWNAIVYSNGQYRCTGTILNSNWILTAAECAEGIGLTENYFAILVGKGKARLEMEGPHEQSIKITKWQRINGTNIVILGTEEPIKFSRYVRAAPLVKRARSAKETCLAIGIDDGRAVFEQLESQKKCSVGFKCFRQIEHKSVCQENQLWSGTITCRSRDGWYAAAVFENVSCSNFDTANSSYTSLSYVKVQIGAAMMSPNTIEHWPPCNGFRCILGRCIENSKVCNGIPDCRSAEDENTDFCDRQENQCHLTDSCVCRTTEMRCTNGKCVPKSQFCDRNNDCGDFSDEPPVCSCMAYLNLTHPERLCDGTLNCYDRTDEDPSLCDCGPGRFRCGSSDFCVSEQTLCDGVPDCPNSEDESRCLSLRTSPINSNSGEVMVRTSGIWHTGCFKPNHTTTELEEICEKLGFSGGSARKLTPPLTTPADRQDLTSSEIGGEYRHLPMGKPLTDAFGTVWIRRGKGNGNKFKVRMRTGFEPYVTFVEDEECHRLFLECL